jgi:uncharacterized damage-inducible protein DinB
MKFNFEKSLEILSRTPAVMKSLLENLDEEWTKNNEGGDSWSPFDVIGHLIHGEKTDWIARTMTILNNNTNKKFEPYDRFAQFQESKGKSLHELLDEFTKLRAENIKILKSLDIDEEKLKMEAIHPKFGAVTLKQLLSTWVIHDLTHIAQISRVMAKQYKEEMGPWVEYFRIMQG